MMTEAFRLKMQAILDAKTIEDGDCLIWTGRTNGKYNHPKYGPLAMRRVVWECRHGAIPPGFLVSVSCERGNCLEHLCLCTRAEVSRKGNTGTDTMAIKRAKSATWARKNISKLNMEIAREIRASDEYCYVLAERYCVNKTLISRIKRNLCWAEDATGGNPFAGLFTGLAANDSTRRRA